MSQKNPREVLVDFVMKELNKAIKNAKDGMTSNKSAAIELLFHEMNLINNKYKSMTEEEIDQWTKDIVAKLALI